MMHGRNAQVARIYRILNLLEGAPQGLSANEIWKRLSDRDCEVSKRTVYRDLQALEEAGFPLFPRENDEGEGATRWTLEGGPKAGRYLALTARELFALHLARGFSVPLKATALKADLDSVFRKIEDRLGTATRAYFEDLASEVKFEDCAAAPGVQQFDTELLETVRAACAESQVLSVEYDSAHSGTVKRRLLGPHCVYFARGSAYLVAEDLAESSQMKVFALGRMKNAVMEDVAFERKAVDHGKVLEKFWSL